MFANFLSHLEEVRRRIFITLAVFGLAFIGGFFFAEPLLTFLLQPLKTFYTEGLVFQKPHEAFLIHVQVAIMAAIFFSSPVIFIQIWQFAAPGLYAHEKKTALTLTLWSIGLFAAGVLFAYTAAIPCGLQFLLSFQSPNLKPLITAEEYFSFLIGMFAAFGVMFDFPVFIIGAVRLGLVSSQTLAKSRRIIILIIFIAAAILTPSPDPASQILLALPLLLLFEGALWFSRRIEKQSPVSH